MIEKEQKIAAAERNEKFTAAKTEISQKFEAGRAELERQTGEARSAIGSDAEKMAEKIAANILKV